MMLGVATLDPAVRPAVRPINMDRDKRRAVVALQAILFMTLAALVNGQGNEGPDEEFLKFSIDCGSDHTYNDEKPRNFKWWPDKNFTSTGENAQSAGISQDGVNQRQAQTLRYFNGPRRRHCYVLQPLNLRRTYLLRVTFAIGDWKSETDNNSFSVYINATEFLRFLNYNSEYAYGTWYYEMIFYSPGGSVNVCLVQWKGTPWISAIELREFSDGMYAAVAGTNKYLFLLSRVNAGTKGKEILRYPEDQYDRLWMNYTLDELSLISSPSVSESVILERPPQKVMEDAWKANNSTLRYGSNTDLPNDEQLAIYSYFQEVDGSASDSNVRKLDYFVNGVLYNTFNVSKQPLEIAGANFAVTDGQFNVSLRTAENSILKPIINAYEFHVVRDFNTSETKVEDANVIAVIKKVFPELMNWDGDPCVPIAFDWLKCGSEVKLSYSNYSDDSDNRGGSEISKSISTLVITNLTLVNVSTTPMETIPKEIGQLTALTELDLSQNRFSNVGESLMSLKALTVLNLSNNNVSTDVKDFNSSIISSSVKYLYMENNSLHGQVSIDRLVEAFPDLEEANFDGNADIKGTLNLSTWLTSLENIAASKTVDKPSVKQLISLRYNQIDQVHPSEDDLTSVLEVIYNSYRLALYNGILLSGNPWCNRIPLKNQSLARQYLCRSETGTANLSPAIRGSKSSNGKVATIIGIIAGSFVLLVCSILLVICWKLRKKSAALGAIHEALAKQKVHPPFFSYGNLRTATKSFSLENKLGAGAFGAVYKGKLVDGTLVAVKTLFPSKLALSEFLNEAVLITGIKHKHLIQLIGCCIKEEQRMLVFEFAENGNLAEALWGKAQNEMEKKQGIRTNLNWEKRLNICIGIGRGLSYLHEELHPRIVHRDIKPENILIDKSFNAKIADFGLARSLLEEQSQAKYTRLAGTLGYFAPEYATQGQLTEKADVFSFGIVLLEIVSGRKCIDHSLPEGKEPGKEYLLSWANSLRKRGALLELLDLSIDINVYKEEMYQVIDIAFLCVNLDPDLRPKMSEAVTLLQGVANAVLSKPDRSLPVQKQLANYFATRTLKFPSLSSTLESLDESRHLLDTDR